MDDKGEVGKLRSARGKSLVRAVQKSCWPRVSEVTSDDDNDLAMALSSGSKAWTTKDGNFSLRGGRGEEGF